MQACFFCGGQEPQEVWDSKAEWLGPAKAVAVVWNDNATTYLLQMDEAGIQDLMDRLGCRPMTQEEEQGCEWRWLEYELRTQHHVQVGDKTEKFISDGSFYLLAPKVEAELENATPEECTRRHNSRSLQYRLARLAGEGQGNLLLSTLDKPWEDRDAKPVLPVYPEYHQQPACPEWVSKTFAIVVLVLFGVGMNFIGNGFVALLGGPVGWFRILLWFLLPLVGWGGYLGLLFLWFTYLSLCGGAPAIFLGALAFTVLAALALGVSMMLSLIAGLIARIRHHRLTKSPR